MPKYLVTMRNTTTWEVEVEANDEDHAHQISFDWGRDELKDDEIVDNFWDISIDEIDCGHEDKLDCPNHEGAYDCTPFCRVCSGNQGYCPICEPIVEDN